jgi:hypothetical protein
MAKAIYTRKIQRYDKFAGKVLAIITIWDASVVPALDISA